MSNPAEVSDLGGGYAVRWPEENIRIVIEYLHKQTQGLIGEITIRDGEVTLCESLRINLNAEPKTKSIAKKVHEYDDRLSLPDWARLIETTCVLVLRRSMSTAYRWVRTKKIVSIKIGRRILIPRSAVAALFATKE